MSITQDCQPQLYTGILVIMLPNQLLYRHGDRQSQRSHSGGEGYQGGGRLIWFVKAINKISSFIIVFIEIENSVVIWRGLLWSISVQCPSFRKGDMGGRALLLVTCLAASGSSCLTIKISKSSKIDFWQINNFLKLQIFEPCLWAEGVARRKQGWLLRLHWASDIKVNF